MYFKEEESEEEDGDSYRISAKNFLFAQKKLSKLFYVKTY